MDVVLVYGEGSIKKNGIYNDVIEIAQAHKASLILAVGSGSVCDYAKAMRYLS